MAASEISYAVCALPRSGSSVLCDALSATELAGDPREYFHPEGMLNCRKSLGLPDGIAMRDYLLELRQRTSTANGVFGFKIMHSHFAGWLEQLEPGDAPAPDFLAGLLPNLRWVWIRRQDLVRQAISLVRATQTGIWHTRRPGQQPRSAPRFEFAEVDSRVMMLQRHDLEWAAFFERFGLSPIRVSYEAFSLDQPGSVRAILESLGIDVPANRALFLRSLALSRQSDAINEEWFTRYQEQKARSQPREPVA